jgi:transcriptional regulator with XRE-family HTH domain
VSRTTIARYEQGLRLLSVQMLIALADALEASADALLGRRVA